MFAQMINNSLSSVYYQWQEVCVENVHIRMEPSEGHIGNPYVATMQYVNRFHNHQLLFIRIYKLK